MMQRNERIGMRALAGLVLGMALAGCAGGTTGGFDVSDGFADPDKFMFYNCTQLAAQIKSSAAREQELLKLMEKASRSPGGSIIGTTAYQPEVLVARGNIRTAQATARRKNCEPESQGERSIR